MDFHDFVFKDDKFVGKFDEMYLAVDDPWGHGLADALQYDLILLLLEREFMGKSISVFDVGCGKGAFTKRISKLSRINFNKIWAVDVSKEAIRKANLINYGRNVFYAEMDIRYYDFSGKFDVIILSQVMWYVLPDFESIVNCLFNCLNEGGILIINQVFYQKGVQKYGNDVVSCVDDMINLVGSKPYYLVELDRFSNHIAVVGFKK